MTIFLYQFFFFCENNVGYLVIYVASGNTSLFIKKGKLFFVILEVFSYVALQSMKYKI